MHTEGEREYTKLSKPMTRFSDWCTMGNPANVWPSTLPTPDSSP